MSASPEAVPTIRAPLNFAANRQDGGVFSNFDPGLVRQSLAEHEVVIRDARQLPSPPKLDAEGFELHRQPFPNGDFHNPEWIAKVYYPQTGEYVKALTGAAHCSTFGEPRALIRDTGKFVPGYAIAAAFVHIDQTLKSGKEFVDRYCDPEIVARYPRVKIINVWRSLTPPPQDVPLAICDQRTLDQRDWVKGSAVEPGMKGSVDNFTSVYNPSQRWHYFSNLTPDEIIVFKAWDNGPGALMGCLHGAFRHPSPPSSVVPRVSAEIRFFCFFDN